MYDLCWQCIGFLRWWSDNSPFSYEEINVVLFILIQPIMILVFFGTTLYQRFSKNEKGRKIVMIGATTLFVVGALIGLASFLVPLIKMNLI